MRARSPTVPPRLPADLRRLDAASLVPNDEGRIERRELHGTLAAPAARHAVVEELRVTAALPGARLPDLSLRRCEVAGADLANAYLRGASLREVTVRDARLTGADLTGAQLQDVTFSGCRLDLVNLADARLDRVAFADCELADAALDEAVLRDVVLERCRLGGTSLHRVRLQRVELRGCDLDRVRSIADLRGAAMPWPDIVANAAALAAAAGVAVLDEDERPG